MLGCNLAVILESYHETWVRCGLSITENLQFDVCTPLIEQRWLAIWQP